ncbi:MAG: hypothetical protein NVS3B20_11650 [Polyangiales bacterium]
MRPDELPQHDAAHGVGQLRNGSTIHFGGVFGRLLKSGGAGLFATFADLATLTGLVHFAGLTPRAASIPAYVVSGAVMFVGQKYFAFRGRGGAVRRELILFALVQVLTLILNATLYDLTLRLFPALLRYYVVVRLVAANLVWLGFSFPLWHFVFKAAPTTKAAQTP